MMARLLPIAAAFAVLATGCGAGFTMQVPDGFVVLDEDEDDSSYAQRATNPHGVVLAVREIDNEPQGNIDFWVEAIRNQVRLLGGYALLEEEEVTAASGERGRQLRFGHDEDGTSFLYWVTLYVTDSRIYVIEAGGRKERFESIREAIEQTLAGFRIG